MNKNVYQLFDAAARAYPDQTAIIDGAHTVTFAALQLSVQQTAAQLKADGLKPGDRVLVFVPMGIDLYRLVLALFQIGATAVFLDEWVSWKRMVLCCQLAECQGFVGIWKARIMSWLAAPIRRIPIRPKMAGYVNFAPDTEVFSTSPEHAALITFTTGSTGTPKAALRSHDFLRRQFDVLKEEINPKAGEVNMTVLPIVLLINLGAGAGSVIARFKAARPDTLDAGIIVRQIILHQVRCLTASPFFVRRIAEYCLANAISLPNLRDIFTGGAPVFPAEAALFSKAFPTCKIQIAYGSTEAEPISLIAAEQVAHSDNYAKPQALTVGQLNAHIDVRIIPITDDPIEWNLSQPLAILPEGEVGEIIVAGPHVLSNYYNNPTALLRQKIYAPDGSIWHRTGDSGFLKNGDHLYLTGRCATLFFHNDRLVCPFLYEGWLLQLSGVSMGTVLAYEGKMLFCIEMEPGSSRLPIEEAIESLNILHSEVRWISKIPRDPRHHSKIDYGRLHAFIQ